MANMNIATPRFYPDLISHLISRGVTQNGEFDVTATGGSGATATRGLQTGIESELFDLNPLNQVSFDTGGDTDSQVLITLDLQDASYKQNYIAILNHNLNSASGKIRVFAGDASSDVATVDAGAADTSDISWGSVSTAEVVNADTITVASDNKDVTIEPASDGTTIFTFNTQDLRYWAIQFEGATGGSGADEDETWGSTDLLVGGIMIGQYYDMPYAPDLNVKRSIEYGATKVQESLGGQRYATATSKGRTASATSKSPFTLGTSSYDVHGGRLNYEMNFSYLRNTDVMPDEYHNADYDDSSFAGQVWNITDGNLRPFIFSVDNGSTGASAESEHIFARFDDNVLNTNHVAHNTYSMGLNLSEEF